MRGFRQAPSGAAPDSADALGAIPGSATESPLTIGVYRRLLLLAEAAAVDADLFFPAGGRAMRRNSWSVGYPCVSEDPLRLGPWWNEALRGMQS